MSRMRVRLTSPPASCGSFSKASSMNSETFLKKRNCLRLISSNSFFRVLTDASWLAWTFLCTLRV